MQETRGQSPGREDPLEKEMAAHSSIPAWRIPRTEESGGLQSMESLKSHAWLSGQRTTAKYDTRAFQLQRTRDRRNGEIRRARRLNIDEHRTWGLWAEVLVLVFVPSLWLSPSSD